MSANLRISENQIQIKQEKPSRRRELVLVILGFALINMLFWLGFFLIKGIYGHNSADWWIFGGFFISSLLLGIIIRDLWWNIYGKEMFDFTDKTINYARDYRLFRTHRKKIDADELKIGIIRKKSPVEEIGRLQLADGQTVLTSRLFLHQVDLNHILRKLKLEYPKELLRTELAELQLKGGKFTFFRLMYNRFGYDVYIDRKSGPSLKLRFMDLVQMLLDDGENEYPISLKKSYKTRQASTDLTARFPLIRRGEIEGFSVETQNENLDKLQQDYDFKLTRLNFQMKEISLSFIFHNVVIEVVDHQL